MTVSLYRQSKLILALALTMASSSALAASVGHIGWDDAPRNDWTRPAVAANQAALVFIRAKQSTSDDSSTNIAINGRYLTSLADGRYSTDVVCAGSVQVSATPTKALTNDLTANAIQLQLTPQQTQYIYIEVDSQYRPTLRQISESQAMSLIAQGYRQTHQISRTNADNCAAPAIRTPVLQPQPVRPAPQALTVTAPKPVATAPSLRLNILFDTNKSNIKPNYQSEIQKAAQFLQQYSQSDIVVEGHTDSVGNDDYNQKLSQRRAESVRQALIDHHGIDATRIRAVGYGESQPIADNSTADGRSQNRRVIVTVVNTN